MTASRMERLHSFLREEGRELKNIKFIPGTSRGLTGEQVAEEAEASLRRVFKDGLVDKPPMSGRIRASM